MSLFFDSANRLYFYKWFSIFISLLSFVGIMDYLPKIYGQQLLSKFLLFILLPLVTYVWICFLNQIKRSIKLRINNTEFEIKFGDIFKEKECLKVISFNEYFDTHVGDGIISKYSLNGIFIDKYYKENVYELDEKISNSLKNQNHTPIRKSEGRLPGKEYMYELGTIACIDNQYLLTSLTHFDQNNNAHVGIEEYILFLCNFWKEVYKLYNGKNITLPILGDGITRFKILEEGTNVDSQKLIEMIIWTYEMSNIKLSSKITIIFHEKNKNNVNLLDLKRKHS